MLAYVRKRQQFFMVLAVNYAVRSKEKSLAYMKHEPGYELCFGQAIKVISVTGGQSAWLLTEAGKLVKRDQDPTWRKVFLPCHLSETP
jgi:hypothetical protein